MTTANRVPAERPPAGDDQMLCASSALARVAPYDLVSLRLQVQSWAVGSCSQLVQTLGGHHRWRSFLVRHARHTIYLVLRLLGDRLAEAALHLVSGRPFPQLPSNEPQCGQCRGERYKRPHGLAGGRS